MTKNKKEEGIKIPEIKRLSYEDSLKQKRIRYIKGSIDKLSNIILLLKGLVCVNVIFLVFALTLLFDTLKLF